MWLGILQMWQQVYVGSHVHLSVEWESTWHLAHWCRVVNWEAKPTLIWAPNMKEGLQMMSESFCPGSERRKVNAPILASRLARVALVQTGPSMGVHALYGRLWPNFSHSCLDMGSEPSGLRIMGTPWNTSRDCPSSGVISKMFGPNGHRRASLYLSMVAIVGRPAKVMVKLEDSGLHHLPANMVISGVASPRCWQMQVSMALMRLYVSPLKGLMKSMAPVLSWRRTFHLVVTRRWLLGCVVG